MKEETKMKFDTKVRMFVKNTRCPTVKLRLIIGGSALFV